MSLMGTFVKIMVVLDINISLQGVGATIQEKCVLIVRDIIMVVKVRSGMMLPACQDTPCAYFENP